MVVKKLLERSRLIELILPTKVPKSFFRKKKCFDQHISTFFGTILLYCSINGTSELQRASVS